MDFIKQIFDDSEDGAAGSKKRRSIGFDQSTGDASASQMPQLELNTSHLRRNRIVAHKKTDRLTGSFDMLRTRLLREMEIRGWKTVAITSPTAASGKTLTAINLAFSISHSRTHSAILADFDLRRPSVANYLGLPTDLKSLVEYFENTAGVRDVEIGLGVPNFVVLPNFFPVENAAETLASDAAENLIIDLRDQYTDGVVIIDLPPLLEVDDALSVLPKVDCVLLVVAAGHSTANQIKECRRLLTPYNLVGTVLNKSDSKSNQYDYY